MRAVLERLWAGIVGVVAGAAAGLALAVLLIMNRFSLEAALASVAAAAVVGGLAAFLTAGRKTSEGSASSGEPRP